MSDKIEGFDEVARAITPAIRKTVFWSNYRELRRRAKDGQDISLLRSYSPLLGIVWPFVAPLLVQERKQ